MIAHPDIVERLASAPPNNLGSSILAQRAALAALAIRDEWFPGVLAAQRRNQALIKAVADGVPGLRLPICPSHGNFVVLECYELGIRPEALVAAYAEHGIMIRQVGYHTPNFGDRFVKVSVTMPEAWV